MKIYLDTIGCRLNQSEIETYARQFRHAGHEVVPDPADADLAVINTCTVTTAAAADSRKKIRGAARAGVGEIVVTGCWSTLEPQAAARLPGVERIISNLAKDQLVPEILQLPPETFDLEPLAREPIPGVRLRTRAFVKVQDGCDNRCTYCITTLARGKGRSRPIPAVLREVQLALAGGAQEVVLTGVHMGSWGKDLTPPQELSALLQAILEETETPRLRLSSLEPWDIDESFLSLWEDDRLARHLHLPLQSGCAATLKRMARKITPQQYARLVETARKLIPGVAITTDIIVGFPGESEADFQESLAFVRQMHFARGHVFTFSERPGTAAARMPGAVDFPIRKARNAAMRAVCEESERQYRASFIGQTMPVLWESATSLGPEGWTVSGLTDNYLRVSSIVPEKIWNQITLVQLTGYNKTGLVGKILAPNP